MDSLYFLDSALAVEKSSEISSFLFKSMCFWQLTEIRPRFGPDGLKHNGMHFINSSEIADPR